MYLLIIFWILHPSKCASRKRLNISPRNNNFAQLVTQLGIFLFILKYTEKTVILDKNRPKEISPMNPEAKTVDDSRVETIHIVRPNHLNGANRLFGGILMQWIDEVAGIVAKRHAMANVTTASVDNLTFLHGAYQNDMIVIKGKLTWVGTSSMEVCVDTYVENLSGERHRINNAHFMMVALDEHDKPIRVPRLILQTEDEHLAWEHGEERRRIRNERRAAKLDGI